MGVSEESESMGTATGERRYTTGKDALSPEQVRRVLGSCERLEQKALLALALSTGMRRSDVVAVETQNVEWQGEPPNRVARVTFWENKKGRWWQSWVVSDLSQPLRLHMESLPRKCRWVFPSPGGRSESGHISSKTAYNWFQEALEVAGIESRPFHALRATCIKLCKARGWSIEQTMEQTGDSWRTIQEHYTTPSDEEMRAAAEMDLLGESDG